MTKGKKPIIVATVSASNPRQVACVASSNCLHIREKQTEEFEKSAFSSNQDGLKRYAGRIFSLTPATKVVRVRITNAGRRLGFRGFDVKPGT